MRRILLALSLTVVVVSVGFSAEPSRADWHRRIAATRPVEADGRRIDFAEQEFAKPLSREDAFRILLNTEVFADAFVGDGGRVSPQVKAFRVIFRQPDAAAAFGDLNRRGTIAGQLYALCGLRLLAPAEYGTAERAMLGASGSRLVGRRCGCMTYDEPVREIVRNPSPNTMRLRRGETIEQYSSRVGTREGDAFDIAGGAIPAMFRDAPIPDDGD